MLPTARHRIREHVDTGSVLGAAVREIHRPLGCSFTSMWMTNGSDRPRLTHAIGYTEAADAATELILRATTTRRPQSRVCNEGRECRVAAPVILPRTGLGGVLYTERRRARPGEGWSAEELDFIEAVAEEAGYAVQACHLYELAFAEKEKSLAILSRVGDGVVVTDSNGCITEANQAASPILECPAESAAGRSCAETLALRLGERELDCSRGCPLVSGGAMSVEVWRRRQDGGRQPLLVSIATVRDRAGEVTEVVHSFRDITRLKEADEAKTMFLATASHELKTPLTVIQGFAQTLIARGIDVVDADRALRAIEQRAIQLNKIVDRLLLSSRIEAGRIKIAAFEMDILPVLAERVDALRDASGRDVKLVADTSCAIACTDPDALMTIIDHLLDNAIKFSPDGGAITVRVIPEAGNVRIDVADSGVGMEPDQAANCFERFWQAESGDMRRFGGTGIGLYIVRSLAEAMGGNASVASAQGYGTTFTFTLPAPVGLAIRSAAGETSPVREFKRLLGLRSVQ